MSETKYTPGPWEKVGIEIGRESGSAFDAVCWMDLSRLSTAREEWKANARLIAAAPELLEALRPELLEEAATAADSAGVDNAIVANLYMMADKARAAIEKAQATS